MSAVAYAACFPTGPIARCGVVLALRLSRTFSLGTNIMDTELQVPMATAAAAMKSFIEGSVLIKNTNGKTNMHSITIREIAERHF